MGMEYAIHDPSFRRDIIRMDEVLQRLRNPPNWNILGKNDINWLWRLARQGFIVVKR